jgi:hypothetical protein
MQKAQLGAAGCGLIRPFNKLTFNTGLRAIRGKGRHTHRRQIRAFSKPRRGTPAGGASDLSLVAYRPKSSAGPSSSPRMRLLTSLQILT